MAGSGCQSRPPLPPPDDPVPDSIGAPGPTRTGTPLRETDFKSVASTDSATGAGALERYPLGRGDTPDIEGCGAAPQLELRQLQERNGMTSCHSPPAGIERGSDNA